MDNAIIVNKTAHGTDVGLLFEVDTNKVQGFGVALGLGIVALACILAKCPFPVLHRSPCSKGETFESVDGTGTGKKSY